jgi:regulatory protein
MEHYEKYLGLVYRYLGLRSRSVKEIVDYLQKKNAPPEVAQRIITSLIEHKFLDDEAFARAWVRSRARSRPKGKRMIQMELKQKGVAEEIIKQVLSEDDEEVPDELSQAKSLIGRRIEKLSGQPRQEIYNKVGAFLARRGFGWDIIKKAIDETLKNDDA